MRLSNITNYPKCGVFRKTNTPQRVGLSLIIMLFSFFGFEKANAQCYGVSATGASNNASVIGAPDGVASAPAAAAGIFVDLGSTYPTGTPVNIYMTGLGGTYTLTVNFSNTSGSYGTGAAIIRSVGGLTSTNSYTLAYPAQWVIVRVNNTGFKLDAVNACPCVAPVVSANTTQATCSGGTANSDGKITLATFNTNAQKVDYSLGSTYTGAGFASAIAVTGTSNFVVASTLPNPASNQIYTVRTFCDATTFTDTQVTLNTVNCASPCTTPIATATATQATCASNVANSNGTLVLNTFDANAKKVDYNIGSTYTGAGFAGAATVGTAPFTVASTLPNPSFNQPYTIRIFCDATTYIDKTVILMPKQCQIADLSLAFSPATQTGNAGEYLTFTATVTNAGPDVATNVKVAIPMPEPKATLLSATTTFGTYNAVSKQWLIPSLPVGTATMTFTVKVN